MRIKQHIKRWCLPSVKTASGLLPYPKRFSQFYLSSTDAGFIARLRVLFGTLSLSEISTCCYREPLTFEFKRRAFLEMKPALAGFIPTFTRCAGAFGRSATS